jgi:hypothetical protein
MMYQRQHQNIGDVHASARLICLTRKPHEESVMNASERRSMNRRLNALIGKSAEFVQKNGAPIRVTIIGRTPPVIECSSTPTNYAFNGSKPSLHRVRCQRIGSTDGWTLSPRLSQLRID